MAFGRCWGEVPVEEAIEASLEMVMDERFESDFGVVVDTLEMLNLPVRFSESPAEISGPAPEFGQHTELLLTEELGYSWDEVTELRKKRVI